MELDPFDQVHVRTFEKALQYFEVKNYPKGSYLKISGEIDRYGRYILDGVAVLCHLSAQGNSSTKYVFLPGTVAYDPYSFSSERPSNYFIVARSDMSVCRIRKSFERELIKSSPEFYPILMKMTRRFLGSLLHWQMEYKELSSNKRYEALLSLYPNLGNILLGKDLTGMLGISRSTLSTLRRNKPML